MISWTLVDILVILLIFSILARHEAKALFSHDAPTSCFIIMLLSFSRFPYVLISSFSFKFHLRTFTYKIQHHQSTS
ncbi:hypothetical protein Hanom_Chr04g00336871 [Helianthus anomalus]